MKTLEEINGQKVWAVDTTIYTSVICGRCMFLNNEGKCIADNIDCRGKYYIPYEEEKTFTLSQINDVIDKLVRYSAFNRKSSFEDIIDVLNQFKSKLEQL